MRYPSLVALAVVWGLFGATLGVGALAGSIGSGSIGSSGAQSIATAGASTTTVDLSGHTPYSTIQSALDSYPIELLYRQTLLLDAGTYTAGFGYVTNHLCGAGNGFTMGGIDVVGVLGPANLDGGTTTGVLSSVTNTTNPSAAWTTLVQTGQSWYPSAMADAGVFVKFTAGTGSANTVILPVIDNTVDTLYVPGQFEVAPAAGATYALLESQTLISGAIASGSTPVVPIIPNDIGVVLTARKAQVIAYGNQCNNSVLTMPDGFLRFKYIKWVGDNSSAAQGWAAIDQGSPISVEESQFTQYGTGARMILPLSNRGIAVSFRRNHIDTGGRIATFGGAGTELTLILDQNDVQKALSTSGDAFKLFLSRQNRYASSTAGSFSANSCFMCSLAGDRFYGIPSFFAGGAFNAPDSSHVSTFNLVNVDAVSMAASNNAGLPTLFSISNGLLTVDHGASTYGPVGASTLNISANSRVVTTGPRGMFRWKHGTTVVNFLGAEPTRSIATNHNLGTGTKFSDLDTSVMGWIDGPYESGAGWSDDSSDLTNFGSWHAPRSWCLVGGVHDPNSHGECMMKHFSEQATANGSGVATLAVNGTGGAACQTAPVCGCQDTNASSLLQIPSSTTTTCVCTALTGVAGAGHVINISGDCNTIK